MSNEIENFKKEVQERINSNEINSEFKDASQNFFMESIKAQYSYNFTWLGRPIIQYPQDVFAMQMNHLHVWWLDLVLVPKVHLLVYSVLTNVLY